MDIWTCVLEALLAARPLQSHLPAKVAINIAIWTAIAWSSRSQLRVHVTSKACRLIQQPELHQKAEVEAKPDNIYLYVAGSLLGLSICVQAVSTALWWKTKVGLFDGILFTLLAMFLTMPLSEIVYWIHPDAAVLRLHSSGLAEMTVSRSGSEPTFFSAFGRHLISLVLTVGLTAACFLEANEESFGWTGLLALLVVMLGSKLHEKPVVFRKAFGTVFLFLMAFVAVVGIATYTSDAGSSRTKKPSDGKSQSTTSGGIEGWTTWISDLQLLGPAGSSTLMLFSLGFILERAILPLYMIERFEQPEIPDNLVPVIESDKAPVLQAEQTSLNLIKTPCLPGYFLLRSRDIPRSSKPIFHSGLFGAFIGSSLGLGLEPTIFLPLWMLLGGTGLILGIAIAAVLTGRAKELWHYEEKEMVLEKVEDKLDVTEGTLEMVNEEKSSLNGHA